MPVTRIDLSRALKPGKLLVVSVLVLFVELALIRYLGSEIPAVGFFKNLILIASFIGLGIGLMQSLSVKPTFLLLALSLLFPLSLVAASSTTGLDPGAYAGLEDEAVLVGGGLAILGLALVVLSFVSTMMPMIFLGRLMGYYFDAFEQPLTAYAWNILGSLVGTILFSVLCLLSTPPVVWFSVSVGLFMVLAIAEWKLLGMEGTVLACVLALLAVPLLSAISEVGELWTPYYKVQVYPMTYDAGEQTGYGLNVNNTWFQRSFDMRYLGRDEELDEEADAARNLRYIAPFVLGTPRRILVLGSGLGNDTARALGLGADTVHAIDIDPVIVALSDLYHPNVPYQDERVQVVIDDARHYLSSTDGTYDLIIFGVLEARSLFSQFANLRLDNYVYTVEAIREADEHLEPAGILWLNLWVPKPWILAKLVSTMETVFQDDFYVLQGRDSLHYALVAGGGISLGKMRALAAEVPGVDYVDTRALDHGDATVPTDDWPYLFYRERQLPVSYLGLLGVLVVLSLIPFVWVNRGFPRIQWTFFFLGAGFLLVETSAVIRMALVAGTTWLVNSAVFVGVLVFIFMANWCAAKWDVENVKRLFLALFATLILVYLFPFHALLTLPNGLAVGISSLLLTLPVFFAGVIFSTLFKTVAVPSKALASNLLGSILGGFSEYLSMLLGNKMISLLALAFYLLAFLFSLRRQEW
jgi:predicted membrane-bound spermidine synthase